MYGNGEDDEESTEKPESDKPEGEMSGDKDDMDIRVRHFAEKWSNHARLVLKMFQIP